MVFVTVSLFIVLLSLTGCFWKFSSEDRDEKHNVDLSQSVYQYEKFDLVDIPQLGFVLLPFYDSVVCYKKSDFLYLVDAIYAGKLVESKELCKTIKELYADSGWALEEECFTSDYVNLFFTKVDRHITVFIQDKSDFNDKNKNKCKLFVHQSMIIYK